MNQVQDVLQQIRLGMSQSEVSRRTGITQTKLSRWEAGRVAAGAEDALKLARLAAELKLDGKNDQNQEVTHD